MNEPMRRCVNCGSEKLAGWGRLLDGAYSVVINRKPGALLFTDPIVARLHALVCGACGYTALFAEKPEELWERYVEAFRTVRPHSDAR